MEYYCDQCTSMAEMVDETDETTLDPVRSASLPKVAERLARVNSNGSDLARVVCFLVAITTIWLFREYAPQSHEPTTTTPHPAETLDSSYPPDSPLCVDIDESQTDTRDYNNASSSLGDLTCACRDPTEAILLGQNWMAHHDRLVLAAETSAKLQQQQQQQQQSLDVVLLGDSIIERWNGTRSMGLQSMPLTTRKVFEQFFDRANNPQAALQGLALGTGGDTTNNLLWHLENGLLPDHFQPKVWLLVIGTNNMGRDGCAKQTTLAGILQVLRVLQEARPNAAVIVHGLLPRSDGGKPNQHALGRLWRNIVWINVELEQQCQSFHNCFYMDSGDIFLRKNKDTNELEIDRTLMEDALHPTDAGYAAWGPLIVAMVQNITSPKQS